MGDLAQFSRISTRIRQFFQNLLCAENANYLIHNALQQWDRAEGSALSFRKSEGMQISGIRSVGKYGPILSSTCCLNEL